MIETMVECNGLNAPFVVVPIWLFAGAFRGLSDGARMLYGFLLSCRLAAWRVPAWSELAAIFGVSRSQIARRFAELQEAGLLRVESVSNWPRTVRYVLLEPDAEPSPMDDDGEHPEVARTTPPVVAKMQPPVVSKMQPLHPIYKREEKKDRDIPPPVPPPGGSGHDEVWQELLSVYPKRAGGLGYSEGRKVLAKLLRERADPKAILDGARRYAEYIRATGREKTEFVAMIPTWLRQRRWEEDWTPPERPANGRGQSDLGGFDVLMRMIEQEEREADG